MLSMLYLNLKQLQQNTNHQAGEDQKAAGYSRVLLHLSSLPPFFCSPFGCFQKSL